MSYQLVQILLIAQEPHDFQWFKQILSKITAVQFNLQWEKTYAEGLDKIIQNKHDLYFLDQDLEDTWGGLDFLKEARRKKCARPIFLLINSAPDDLKIEQIKAIEAAGATDYFQKSKINAESLVHSIRSGLKVQEMNQALRLSQERYTLALSAGEVGVWDWNLQSNELYISPHLKALVGYGNDEINPNWPEWQQLIHPGDRDRVQAVFDNHLAGLTSQYEVEYRRLHKDGTWRWFLSRGNTLRDANGQPCRIVGSETDITERKQLEAYLRQSLEKEKEINQLKSKFLTMVSHEFRTPLSTILSSADLLEFYIEELQTQNALNHVERLQKSAEYMTQMLNDVLAMENAKTGKLNFNPTWLDLHKFCDDFVKNLEVYINKNKVLDRDKIFIKNESDGLEINGFFDKKIIKQMLHHLLWNAVKYSEKGESIVFEINATNNEQIILKVTDLGVGIATEEQSKIFDMFYRGNNIENIPGSGLGLAIVKSCVYLHGGQISVQSTIGVGSTFTVKLPWHKSEYSYEDYVEHLTDVEIMNTALDITKIENPYRIFTDSETEKN